MCRRPLVYWLGELLLTSFGVAGAQNAYTARPMNVRAGPNRDYPLVAQLGPGTPLDVHGCLDDWSWCDVSFDGNRGWMYAGGISFVYEGERVPLYSYGPHLGLPIITFSLLTYWGDYYRGRPWFSRRDEWAHRRLPPHTRPPGRPHAGPPPVPYPRRPPAGPRPSTRGPEHGYNPQPERPRARPPAPRQPRPPAGGRPGARGPAPGYNPPPGQPRATPPSTPRVRAPAGGRAAAPRGGERGRTGPPGRGAQTQDQQQGRESRQREHPPLGD